jgi:hypothetical protein
MQTLTPESPAGPQVSPVHASFMWDRAEHYRLVREITRHAQLARTVGWVWVAMFAMVAFTAGVPLAQGNWEGLGAAVPWALLLVFWFVLFRWGAPWNAARMYPKQHPCVSSPFHVALADEGVRTTCNHTDVLVRWGGVRRAVETREFFLLYTSDRCAHYLPKRALHGAGELASARETVLRHLPLKDATNR